VLQASPKKFHTATEVRDELRKLKFDFSQYTANPLSSIHAALKRFKPEEAEVTKTEGVMAWRWKDTGRKLRRRRRIPKYNTYRGLNVLSVPNAYESTMYDLQPSSLLNMSTLLDTEAPRIILPSEANKNPRTK
jgi:hypothetical protein